VIHNKITEADIVVVGGGSAGVGAAVAAGRSGAKTILIEASYLLGGIIAKSLGMPLDAAYPYDVPIGGICEEWLQRLYNYDPPAATKRQCLLKGFGIETFYDPDYGIHELFELCSEAGVVVIPGAVGLDMEMKDEYTVKSVIYYDKGGRHDIITKYVIDCTGDGDIAANAGIPYVKGDGNGDMMAGTVTFMMANVNIDVAFNDAQDPFKRDIVKKAQAEGKMHPEMYNLYQLKGQRRNTVLFNCVHIKGIDGTDIMDVNRSTLEARKIAFELVKYIIKELPGYENAYLESMGSTIGIRETRRLEGVYELSAEDCLSGRKFPDGVVACNTSVDDVLRGKSMKSVVKHDSLIERGVYFTVPFSSLIPKKHKNILFAGRCLSADFTALAIARNISTCFLMGQATGVAAGLALKENLAVQDVNRDELIGLLKNQGVNGLYGDEIVITKS